MTKFSLTTLLLALLLGCSSEPPQATSTSQPVAPSVETETGRFALQKMIPPARFWNSDAGPIRLESSITKESNGHDGKSASWTASFGSASQQKSEQFDWSGVSAPGSPKGVSHEGEDSFNPANRSTQTFDLNYLKVDSDEAFKVAQQHGGKELLAKNPKTNVTYLLDFDPRLMQLRWHVIYGDRPSQVTVLVDASSGQFIHKE